jgi:hypothetical protein
MCSSCVFVLVGLILAGCATTPDPSAAPSVTYSQRQVFNIFEAALRYRLRTSPLQRHSVCYIYLENTDVSIVPFAKRFPDYRMIVRRNSPGKSPPSPWYYMRLGRTTQDHAWVSVQDAAGGMLYTLHRDGSQWVVVEAELPIVI